MPPVETLALPAATVGRAVVDRRRVGRIDYSNPHLLDLLRQPHSPRILLPAKPDIESEPVLLLEPYLVPEPVVMLEAPASIMSAFPFIIVASLFFWGVVAMLLWKTMFH